MIQVKDIYGNLPTLETEDLACGKLQKKMCVTCLNMPQMKR